MRGIDREQNFGFAGLEIYRLALHNLHLSADQILVDAGARPI